MHYYVYITTNTVNGRKYIGKHQTNDMNDGYLGSGTLLRRAIKKYGKGKFSKEIVYIAKDHESLIAEEVRLIEAYNAVSDPLFYNIAFGGAGGDTYSGASLSDKQKLANLVREANSGRPKSKEHQKNLSEAKIGKSRNWSPETTQRYKEDRKRKYADGTLKMPVGNTGNKDFRHSESTKQRLRENMKTRLAKAAYEGRDYQTDQGKEMAKKKVKEFWTEEERAAHSEKLRQSYARRKEAGLLKKKIWIHNQSVSPIMRGQINENDPIPVGWVRGKGIDK